MHGQRQRHPRCWIIGSIAGLLLVAAAGCSTGSPSASGDATAPPAGSVGTTSASPAAVINAQPALNSSDLAPSKPVIISVAHGSIDTLTMTNSDGAAVNGTLSADRTRWMPAAPLAFGATYTVSGTATGTDGRQVPISGSYSTVSQDVAVKNTVYPTDDMTVGVAAPVVVRFAVEPQDKAAIAEHVTLTSEPAVEGAWAWIKHNDDTWSLDYRTRTYWPAGTRVHVSAKLYGVKVADGAYGRADITSDFTIGRNQVVKADVNSHELVVTRDGVVTATYPASYGRGEDTGDPNLITRSGIHVVNEFFETKLMNNPRYGYTNSSQKWAVRISNNGEFIHANPASSGAQGSSNVTHGCVNLSLGDAQAYYESAIWGDPVEVTGTSVQLSAEDGDIYNWALSWDEWKAMAAG